MNLKILKKDLKRKKSMNFILLVFVMLATTFIAASVNNMKIVTNGVAYYFEKAQLGDFILTAMEDQGENIEVFLEGQKNVTKYDMAESILLPDGNIEEIGDKEFEFDNTIFVFNENCNQQKFFDENNEEITELEEGEVLVTRKMIKGDFKVGSSFYIVAGNYKKKFIVKGIMKDALTGGMVGLTRILVSEKDFEELQAREELTKTKWYSVHCDDVESFEQDYYSGDFNVLVGESKDTFRASYVMDVVIAGILLAVSVCLILIAAIMLRFTIIFTVNEDYKEIGIMKAIGIPNQAIRSLYVWKYLVLSVIGAAIGCGASIPFSQMLIEDVTKNIVVEESGTNLFLTISVSILVALVVTLFAFISTGRVKKFTPMDAIRSGNNGERFEKKSIFRLGKSRMRPTTFMALNDVLCEMKKYSVLLITAVVGVWLVIMPVNTINTLKSDNLHAWIDMTRSHFYIMDKERVENLMLERNDAEGYENYIAEVEEQLKQNKIGVERVSMEVMFQYKIRKGDKGYNSSAFQGVGTTTDLYTYEEGSAPEEENEIAITHIVAEKIDAEIGDTVYITMSDEEVPFIVTAIYQSMFNLGDGIRFHENAQMDYDVSTGGLSLGVVLTEEPESEELEHIIQKVRQLIPEAKVQSSIEYMDSMIGVAGMIQPVKDLILVLVLVINILVVVLMQKMFLIREQGEMGTLKAMGFSNKSIISWQTKRIALVLFVGVLIGTLTGTLFSELTSGQVFKFMGCSKIEFQINPLEVYVLYPVVIYVVTVLACVISMQKVKKISVDNMKDEE